MLRVGAIFASGLLRTIRFLQLHWDQLADDIEVGSLTPRVTDSFVREAVAGILLPDQELARFLGRHHHPFSHQFPPFLFADYAELTSPPKIQGGKTTLSGFGGGAGAGVDTKVLHAFQTSFVQSLQDQNRVLINEINQNHESKVPSNLSYNVGLIRELNNNIRHVVDLYADLSSLFAASGGGHVAFEGGSVGTISIIGP
nr:uncharacterized protein LOC117844312 [Setaria viridis]